jgi:hypothetical protein
MCTVNRVRGKRDMEALREVGVSRLVDGARGARSRVLLTLDEVQASGRRAYFYDYDEELIYLDGELYDLRDAETAEQAGLTPHPLPREILESGVGLEYGWRHIAGCTCRHCRRQSAEPAGNASGRTGAAVA